MEKDRKSDDRQWDSLLQGIVQGFWKETGMDHKPSNTVRKTILSSARSAEDAAQSAARFEREGIADSQPVLIIGKFPQGNVARYLTRAEFDYLTTTEGAVEEDILWTYPPRAKFNVMPEHPTIQ